MEKPRIYTINFATVYPLYVTKVERKGRSKDELDKVLTWLTGYSSKQLESFDGDFETFVAQAPKLNPNRNKITGVICGVRVEEIDDKTTQEIRYIDKVVDELAKGKALEKILR